MVGVFLLESRGFVASECLHDATSSPMPKWKLLYHVVISFLVFDSIWNRALSFSVNLYGVIISMTVPDKSGPKMSAKMWWVPLLWFESVAGITSMSRRSSLHFTVTFWCEMFKLHLSWFMCKILVSTNHAVVTTIWRYWILLRGIYIYSRFGTYCASFTLFHKRNLDLRNGATWPWYGIRNVAEIWTFRFQRRGTYCTQRVMRVIFANAYTEKEVLYSFLRSLMMQMHFALMRVLAPKRTAWCWAGQRMIKVYDWNTILLLLIMNNVYCIWCYRHELQIEIIYFKDQCRLR